MNEPHLLVFSILLIIALAFVMIVQVFLKKAPLLSAYNFFLFGSIIFVGLSGVSSAFGVPYFSYDGATYLRYYIATTIFYVTFVISYARFSRAKVFQSDILKVPTEGRLLALSVACVLFALAQIYSVNMPGVGRVLQQLGVIMPVFGVVVIACLLLAEPKNFLLWCVFLGIVTLAIGSLFGLGGGRRALYSTLLAFPVALYWFRMRKMSPWTVICLFGIVLTGFLAFDRVYNSVRWAGTSRSSYAVSGAGERLKMMGSALEGTERTLMGAIGSLGQTGVEYSLTSIYLYSSKTNTQFSQKPFHTLYVLGTLPIPSEFWPDKPEHLGLTLLFDAGVMGRNVQTNCGPGIAGQCYHEGGLIFAVFYAVLLAAMLSKIDNILIANPTNPVVLGFLAASAPHVVGWSRGDISVFTAWIFISAAAAVILYKISTLGITAMPAYLPHPHARRSQQRMLLGERRK